jgi:hypothetical protein
MAVLTVNCFIFWPNNTFRPQKCTFLINFFLFLTLNKQRTPNLMYRDPSALWTLSREATTIERPRERCCAFCVVLLYLFLIRRVKSGSLIILLSEILCIWHIYIYLFIYFCLHTNVVYLMELKLYFRTWSDYNAKLYEHVVFSPGSFFVLS